MHSDEVNAMWERAVRAKAQLAEELFANGGKPTPTDIIAVALAHPEAYEINIIVKK